MSDIQYLRLTDKDRKMFGNPFWRITHWYWIQTKKSGVRTVFSPKRAQRKLARILAIWKKLIVLKCRQLGISTFFLIWHLDATMMTPDTTTCILAHEQKQLDKLFRIIKIAYESAPDSFELDSGDIWHKPRALYDTKNELYFAGINSRIYVALQVRGDTIHRLHISEMAFIRKAEEVLTATLGAVPDDGVVTIESTANGVGGQFHEQWLDAMDPLKNDSPYAALFLGFQESEDYVEAIQDEAWFRSTLTPEELKMHETHGVSLNHLAWRRKKRSDINVRKKFEQEYPCHDREAFMHSGSGIFNVEALDDWIIMSPIEKRMDDHLLIWKKAQAGEVYILSADTSSGEGKEVAEGEKDHGTDNSCIQVWNARTLQMVARYKGKYPYSKLHTVIEGLAREYNMAYVIIESYPSAHGLTVVNNLWYHTDYPHNLIHCEKALEKTAEHNKRKLGWYTTEKSKTLIIDELQTAIEDGTVRCHDRSVQGECYTFITHPDGSMGAVTGYKDDGVMAMAIATYSKNVAAALRALRDNTKLSKASLNLR